MVQHVLLLMSLLPLLLLLLLLLLVLPRLLPLLPLLRLLVLLLLPVVRVGNVGHVPPSSTLPLQLHPYRQSTAQVVPSQAQYPSAHEHQGASWNLSTCVG